MRETCKASALVGFLQAYSAYAFPAIVHQLWSPGGMPAKKKLRRAMMAWKREPSIEYKLWNDTTAVPLLQRHGGESAVEAYRVFAPAQKKDFFMYVVLAQEGGLFVDCDVRPLEPPGRWLREFALHGDDVLLGLEALGSEEQQLLHRWASIVQLTVWAVASEKNSTVMNLAADSILRAHLDHALASDYMSTILSTGPGLLTRIVEIFLAQRGVGLYDFKSIIGNSKSDTRHRIRILNINGFGCGQDHSSSANCSKVKGIALLQHEFAGTWKYQLCANVTGFAFDEFARLQQWEERTWLMALRRRTIRLECGPSSIDDNTVSLLPLFAPPYPPQLPRPVTFCELFFGLCGYPFKALPLPPLGQEKDLSLIPKLKTPDYEEVYL